ncbi:unnamed protein product [Heligmosomoides polygyrus]|uniref:Hexosyltransferase n=1 Tax=Heligmosomoides polygyrus TaxID=6339 RepID=A0A183FD86_HELPZ|nr:unnamed protein product [Heligmosomoides polygyrus]
MSVRIVLKIDDDVAWNVDSMIKYLSEIDDGDRAVLHCPSSWNPIVPRHVLYPWYIHPEEYPGKHFPSYCLSGASATTPQTIAKLAEATSTVPFVWLDDVFSNGMVPQKIGATFIHMPFGPDKFPFDSLLNGSHNFTTVFPLGLSDSENVNNDVKKEHKKYGDILQSDFLDTYGNLTLKTYSYSNYVRQRCMAVRAVLKVDDDLAWNVDRMFVYLSEIADDDKVVLHCRSVKNPLVSRDVNARWYVTPEEYPYKYFPEYCLSPVYAATPKTIAALANATARIPHLWLDDVWSLGIVAWEAGATFQPLSFNVEREIFEPFLNGSVITQYFLRKLDGLYLFDTVNAKLMS